MNVYRSELHHEHVMNYVLSSSTKLTFIYNIDI